MSFIQSIILGIIQGITEFLPVSSSGHLAIFKHVFKITSDTGVLYDVLLHFGTLVAVCVAFHKDIAKLIIEFICIIRDICENFKVLIYNKKTKEGKRYRKILFNNYRKFVFLIIIATIPTGVLGYMMQGIVEKASRTLIAPGAGLLITGVLLLVVDYVPVGKKIPKDTHWSQALIVGIAQGIAVFPGISRSGATISSGLLCGFNRKFAVKFSFIMSIPAILGAMVLELKNFGSDSMTTSLVFTYLLGAVFAGIVGYFCIRFMLKAVENRKLKYFSYYCFFIGIVAIICNFTL